MQIRSVFIHVALAISIGAMVAAFTPARWLAASLWVSAALMINAAIAIVEDARPGGFDNPDGLTPTSEANALAFKVAAMALALAGLGLAAQLLGAPSP